METIEFFVKVLNGSDLFKGLTKEQVELIAGCAKNVSFSAGDTLFHEGEQADNFYLLREGLVAIDIDRVDQKPMTIQTVDPGEVVGWSWLFPPYEWRFHARAIQNTRAVALDAKCLRGKLEADPALGYELMKRFSTLVMERLGRTRLQLLDIYGPAST